MKLRRNLCFREFRFARLMLIDLLCVWRRDTWTAFRGLLDLFAINLRKDLPNKIAFPAIRLTSSLCHSNIMKHIKEIIPIFFSQSNNFCFLFPFKSWIQTAVHSFFAFYSTRVDKAFLLQYIHTMYAWIFFLLALSWLQFY